jgi:hypothetical protein
MRPTSPTIDHNRQLLIAHLSSQSPRSFHAGVATMTPCAPLGADRAWSGSRCLDSNRAQVTIFDEQRDSTRRKNPRTVGTATNQEHFARDRNSKRVVGARIPVQPPSTDPRNPQDDRHRPRQISSRGVREWLLLALVSPIRDDPDEQLSLVEGEAGSKCRARPRD